MKSYSIRLLVLRFRKCKTGASIACHAHAINPTYINEKRIKSQLKGLCDTQAKAVELNHFSIASAAGVCAQALTLHLRNISHSKRSVRLGGAA
jgi:hypothetical protein